MITTPSKSLLLLLLNTAPSVAFAFGSMNNNRRIIRSIGVGGITSATRTAIPPINTALGAFSLAELSADAAVDLSPVSAAAGSAAEVLPDAFVDLLPDAFTDILPDFFTDSLGFLFEDGTAAASKFLVNFPFEVIPSEIVTNSLLPEAVVNNPAAVEAEMLTDGSHVFMDFPFLFNFSRLRLRYAQVFGRILLMTIGLLPNSAFTLEEWTIQFLLLAVNLRPVFRSMKLFFRIRSVRCDDTDDDHNVDNSVVVAGGEYQQHEFSPIKKMTTKKDADVDLFEQQQQLDNPVVVAFTELATTNNANNANATRI